MKQQELVLQIVKDNEPLRTEQLKLNLTLPYSTLPIGSEKNSFFTESLNYFISYTKEKINQNYIFDGGEGRALKLLLAKLKSVLKNYEKGQENLFPLFQSFISNIKDQWVLDHWDLKIINSKFNQLTQKNGSTRKSNSKDFTYDFSWFGKVK